MGIHRPRTVHLDQRQRLLIAAGLGVASGVIVALFCPLQLSLLAGWDTAAAFIVGSTWSFITILDSSATHRVATREDDSRTVVDVIVVAASVVSLAGVVAGLARAKSGSGSMETALTCVSVFTVLLSWFTVHTLFVLRYAHLFYREPVGGISFDQTNESPNYADFAYFALTIGMTFQVSDTQICDRTIRMAVTRHALLSYLFGTVIVGVTINVVGGLIG